MTTLAEEKDHRAQHGFREERDSLGSLRVPVNALYQAQTQRAVNNFPMSGITMPADFIRAVVMIKRTAAQVNAGLGVLDPTIAEAIVAAAEDILNSDFDENLDGQFPVDVFQTGSGTSTNMNVNEVLTTLATRRLDDNNLTVSPNDHVNCGQSSNDVIPSAIQISSALALHRQLLPALEHLKKVIDHKGQDLRSVVKTGRTHLMDAMPLTFEQELSGWSAQINSAIQRLESVMPRLCALPQGGTAVGTGINAHPEFAGCFVNQLGLTSGLSFTAADNYFSGLASQDVAVELSGQLRTLAVALMKISNDLRWMNSGPLAGLGEIELEALQPGSSIMPGKVNPVIPEAVAMVSAQVMGNDATIGIAGQSGNFQLNVMLPVIAFNLLQSIELLANASRLLADKAIAGFRVRSDNIEKNLARNPILATALNAEVGYLKAAEIAKAAYAQQRSIVDVALEMTDIPRDKLEKLLNPASLTKSNRD